MTDTAPKKPKRRPKWTPKEVHIIPHVVPDEQYRQILRELGQLFYEQIMAKRETDKPVSTDPIFEKPKIDATEKVNTLLKSVGLDEISWNDQTSCSVYLCHNDQVIGFGTFYRTGAQGLVHSIAVRPDFQGQGYGKKILRELEQHAKVIGVSKFYCCAKNSVGFFKKLGFIEPAPAEIHPKIINHKVYKRDSAKGILLFKAPKFHL